MEVTLDITVLPTERGTVRGVNRLKIIVSSLDLRLRVGLEINVLFDSIYQQSKGRKRRTFLTVFI